MVNDIDKQPIKKDYANGMKYKDLAQKYDININTLKAWAKRENWKRGNKDKSCGHSRKRVAIQKLVDVDTPIRQTKRGKYQEWLEPDGLTRLEAWARDGLTDEQIAHNMGIRRETLIQWKKLYVNISNALKKGKEVVDIEVENALNKRARGYEFTEEKVEIETDSEGNVKSRKVTQTIKNVPPDVGAAAIWLKNRLPKKWRDHPEQLQGENEMEDDGLYDAIKNAVEKMNKQ